MDDAAQRIERYLAFRKQYGEIIAKLLRHTPSGNPVLDDPIYDELESRQWDLGTLDSDGCYRSPDPQPDTFDELDLLLEALCPAITVLQYKRIYRNVVDFQTGSRLSDGGDYACRRCRLFLLFEELLDMGLIDADPA